MMLIPARIYQIGPSPSDANPTWAFYHPTFAHVFLNDTDCDALSRRMPWETAASAYRAVKVGAQRADLCRLMVVYAHGGIYVDTDAIAQRSLTAAVPPWATLFLSEYGAFEFFGAIAGHPFVERALLQAVANVHAEVERCRAHKVCCRGSHACIVKITGPKSFFESIVAAGRVANCSNDKWIPRTCHHANDSRVRGYFRCVDTGQRRNPYRTTMCGVARHADCRNSGIGVACKSRHYSRQRSFFEYASALATLPNRSEF